MNKHLCKTLILTSIGFCCLSISATVAVAQDDEPIRYALLVAVTKYRHSAMNKPSELKFPEVDAKAIGKFLEDHGYKVEYLLGSRATKDAIESKLKNLAEQGNSSGVCLVGFWGHGVEFEGSDESMFCPYDSRIRFAEDSNGNQLFDDDGKELIEPDPESLVGMGAVLRGMRLCGAGNKLLLADCCRKSPNRARGRAFGSEVKLTDLPDNTAAIFACKPNEVAFEHDSWGHGAFSKAFLDLLPGQMAKEDTSVTSILALLKRDVNSLVRKISNGRDRQNIHPIINGLPDLKLKKGESLVLNSIGLKLKLIPVGGFVMGSRDSAQQIAAEFNENAELFANEHPQRTIEIKKPFYIGTTEVTFSQFKQFVDATGYRTQAEKGELGDGPTDVANTPGANWKMPEGRSWTPEGNYPVSMVTYYDAVKFCQWLSEKEGRKYRLPTDEEWEYAGRAGSKTRFWNGNDPRNLTKIANVPDSSLARLRKDYGDRATLGKLWLDSDDGFPLMAPVGSLSANPWGLHDIHGNVWEWCTVADARSLKLGANQLREMRVTDARDLAVIRGGCFY